MPFIKEDTYSNYNRNRLYAKAGDEVDIVRDTGGGVLIVETKGGEKFPIFLKDLSDENILIPSRAQPDHPSPPLASKKTAAIRRSNRAQPGIRPNHPAGPDQGALF